MLFVFLFFMPLLGAAWGAIVGAIGRHFANQGIGRDFIEQVRGKVKEGTSARFLLVGRVTTDWVVEAFKGGAEVRDHREQPVQRAGSDDQGGVCHLRGRTDRDAPGPPEPEGHP
jgi:hypothetical protein